VIKMQVSARPKPPRQILGEGALSTELEQIIIKALEKDRFDRFGTAAEMAAAIRVTPEGRALPAPLDRRPSSTDPPPDAKAVEKPAGRSAWPLRAAIAAAVALGAFAAVQRWPIHALPVPAPVREPVRPVETPAPIPAPAPNPPPPAKVVEPWLAHRDLAVTYAGRGRPDDAFREIEAALRDDAVAAAADPVLAEAAANTLTNDRISFVVERFRENPRLIEALAATSGGGATPELRHAAYDALGELDQRARADLFAMGALDLEQATKCAEMRTAFKQLRASKDPRVRQLTADLRARGRKDPQVRCLRRLLRR
jgi:hypothetical protein